VEIAGAVVILVFGIEQSDKLTDELNESLLKLIHRKDYDPRATRILNKVQEYVRMKSNRRSRTLLIVFQVGCCGASGSNDYNKAHKPVPMECRNPVTGIEYR